MKKGYFYFVPIFYNEETHDIKARNIFLEIPFHIMLFIHCQFVIPFTGLEDFPIKIEDYEQNKKTTL